MGTRPFSFFMELISNASDVRLCFVNYILIYNYYYDLMLIMQNRSTFQFQALDKIRLLSLTEKEILGEGDNTKPGARLYGG
jgi:hypothetical protein